MMVVGGTLPYKSLAAEGAVWWVGWTNKKLGFYSPCKWSSDVGLTRCEFGWRWDNLLLSDRWFKTLSCQHWIINNKSLQGNRWRRCTNVLGVSNNSTLWSIPKTPFSSVLFLSFSLLPPRSHWFLSVENPLIIHFVFPLLNEKTRILVPWQLSHDKEEKGGDKETNTSNKIFISFNSFPFTTLVLALPLSSFVVPHLLPTYIKTSAHHAETCPKSRFMLASHPPIFDLLCAPSPRSEPLDATFCPITSPFALSDPRVIPLCYQGWKGSNSFL